VARAELAEAGMVTLWCDWGVARGDGDADGLVFVAEMYGVQVDQLAVVLDVTAPGGSISPRPQAGPCCLSPGPTRE